MQVWSSDVYERFWNLIDQKLNLGEHLDLEFGDKNNLDSVQVFDPKKNHWPNKLPILTKKA